MGAPLSTNATKLLEANGTAFGLAEFAAADFTAEEVCEKLGVPPEEVFKTLVVKGDRTGPLVAVIPTGTRLSSKKLARLSGNRSVSMVSPDEMERLTGYVKGAAPLSVRKVMPLFAHESIRGRERIYCSAGQRGVQLVMKGDDFVSASGGSVADLVEG